MFMKRPALFVFITLLVAFGSFVMAQENQNTHSQPSMSQQKNKIQGQGNNRYTNNKRMMGQGMMSQSSIMDCSGCIVNRVLMRSGNFYLDMRKSLGLTDAQVDKLQKIRLDYAKQIVDIQGELYITQIELQDMLADDEININKADRKIRDTYDLEAELQIKKVKSMIMARNVLTPSQREQVKSMTRRDMMLPVTGNGQEQRR